MTEQDPNGLRGTDDDARIDAAMKVVRSKLESATPSFESMLSTRATTSRKSSRAWAAVALAAALVPVAMVFFVLPISQRQAPSAAAPVMQEAPSAELAELEAPSEPSSADWYPIAEPEPLRFLLDVPTSQSSSEETKP